MNRTWQDTAEHVATYPTNRREMIKQFDLSSDEYADMEFELEKYGVVFCIKCGFSVSDDLINDDGECEGCMDEDV